MPRRGTTKDTKTTKTEGFEQEVAEETEKDNSVSSAPSCWSFFGSPRIISGPLSRSTGRGSGLRPLPNSWFPASRFPTPPVPAAG